MGQKRGRAQVEIGKIRGNKEGIYSTKVLFYKQKIDFLWR